MKYSIVQQPNQKGTKFTVDEETGEVSTNKVFDREGDDGKFVSVTVKATDQGEPSLEGVCSFTVEITDVNDNVSIIVEASSKTSSVLGAPSQLRPFNKYLFYFSRLYSIVK